MSNWYVITGAPSSGKTTILDELSKKGYKTVDEAARIYIDKEMQKGKTIEEIRSDELFFQSQLLTMKLNTEKDLIKDELVFFDRGMHDTIAYFNLFNLPITPSITNSMKNSDYKMVFIFELLEYKKDYSRTESIEQVLKIEELLIEAYSTCNIPVVRVPFMNIEDRIEFILKYVKNGS
jgi:predicted ATPase